MMLHTYLINIKALCIVVSEKKICSCVPYVCLCKTCDALPGQAHFSPKGINYIQLVEVYYVILQTNIRALDIVVSDRKIFFYVFPISAYAKHVTTGAGPFMAPGL